MIPARLKLLLFNLLFSIPVICFSQGPGTSTNTDVNGSGVYMQVFRPYNYLTGLHPLVIEGKGAGEAYTFNMTPLSLGDFGKNYGWTGRYVNDAKGGVTSTVYVVTIHDGATTSLIKTAITWAKANLPGVDTTQMIYTGWSLAGGAGLDIMASDTIGLGSTGRRLSAVVLAAPVAPSSGTFVSQIYPGLNKVHIPLFMLDATNDGNSNTNIVTSGLLGAKQGGGLSATPEVKYYFPNTNNTTYQSTGGHQAAQRMMNDTTVGSKNVFLDSSNFTGHTNPNATVSVRNLMEQALAYSKGAGNIPPVANTGSNQTITLPTSTGTLNGTGSTDADGTITTYAWVKLSGPSTYTITSASSASTTATGLVAGTYVFQLTVTDNNSATSSATVQIQVNASSTPPTAVVTANQTVTLPVDSAFIADIGSHGNGGPTIVGWSFTYVSGPVGAWIYSYASSSTKIYNLMQGVYVFKLTVTDNNGNTGSANTQVTVSGGVPSCITNTSPADGAVLLTPTTATVSWNTSAVATSYDVYRAGVFIANTTNTFYGFTGLAASTSYSWYVVPKNATGDATGCSGSATSFTTQTPPTIGTRTEVHIKRIIRTQ